MAILERKTLDVRSHVISAQEIKDSPWNFVVLRAKDFEHRQVSIEMRKYSLY